jgi:hypothetical protein
MWPFKVTRMTQTDTAGKKRIITSITRIAILLPLALLILQSSNSVIQEYFMHPDSDGGVSASAASRPMLIGMFRGDVNQQAMANLYKTYLIESDLIFSSVGPDPLLVDSTRANVALSGGILSNLKSLVTTKSAYNYVIYDLEKAAGPEYYNYVDSTRKAYEAAHANGYKLILTPAYPDLPIYAKDIAPYGDIFVLQINPAIRDYVTTVQQIVSDIRSINSRAIVLLQIMPSSNYDPSTAGTNNLTPQEVVGTWNSVKGTPGLSGLQIFYFDTPDPVPILQQIYDGIGIPKNRSDITSTTQLSLDSIQDTLWGSSVKVKGQLTDRYGIPIAGKTITFNGNGSTSLGSSSYTIATDSNGRFSASATAPSSVSKTWTLQAHFAGDTAFSPSSSIVDTYSTLPHSTSLTLSNPSSVPWGNSIKFSSKLYDSSTGGPISNAKISYDNIVPGSSVLTDSNGLTKMTITAPNSVGTGWSAQTSFAGNSLYTASSSDLQKYSTTKHSVKISINLSPSTTIHPGKTYSIYGSLRDGTIGSTLAGRQITLSADSPIISTSLPSSVTTDSSGSFSIKSIVVPNSLGTFKITAHYAGNSLYVSGDSSSVSLTIS